MPTSSTSRPRSSYNLSRAALALLGFVTSLAVCPAADWLQGAPTAFLRASAVSPVAWQPWDAAVLLRAKAEGRPVYVFAGSGLNELSRATCAQSFTNADTAAFLNQNFICILVDREAEPDVAALIMHYLRTVKQTSTWPAHVWLTPELQPFEGAGYLPPSEEWGKPSFMKVAQQALAAWTGDPAGCRTRAAEAVAQLAAPPPTAAWAPEKLPGRLAAAAGVWRAQYDSAHGGFGDPPKKPEPELLRFLLRQTPADRAEALATLRAMAGQAVRDPLDGGFFHYAADAAWAIPYQQKHLADQARLALAYLDAGQGDDAAAFTASARGALDYALRRLRRPDGTFAAAEDATGEPFAAYYAWKEAEIDAALGPDAAAFKHAYGVLPGGNVAAEDDASGQLKERNLLHAPPVVDAGLAASAARLLAVRAQRPAPPTADGATAGAHGLLLAALARAGAQPGGARYLAAAADVYATLAKGFVLSPAGDLRRQPGSDLAAAPADYAAVALGCREFARAAKRPEAEALAAKLLARAGTLFLADGGGRYFATPPALPPGFFVRPPAGNDVPAAEPLALLAGLPPAQGRTVAAALAATLEEGVAAPGDTLLALALFPSN